MAPLARCVRQDLSVNRLKPFAERREFRGSNQGTGLHQLLALDPYRLHLDDAVRMVFAAPRLPKGDP